MDPDQMRQALRMMRDNSGMLEQMRAAVTNMTPEQLQAGVGDLHVVCFIKVTTARALLCSVSTRSMC